MTRTRDKAVPPGVDRPASLPSVPVDEPAQPQRIRRPSDPIRFAISVAGLVIVLVLISIAQQTTHGLQTDIQEGTARAPHRLLQVVALISRFGVLTVPVAFAIDRLLRRDGLRIAVGLLAAVISVGVTVALDAWVIPAAPDDLAGSLLWGNGGGAPVHADITPVIAFVTAVRLTGRPRWQLITWSVIALAALTGLTAGYASAAALAATYFLGRAIGYGTLYAVGTPNPRPPGGAVMAALRRVGLVPARSLRLADAADGTRRYGVAVETATPQEGRLPGGDWQLQVTVLDRDLQSAGLLYRMWWLARLRGGAPRRAFRSLRRSLEQESLMAYAVGAAGARSPRLVVTSEVGSEAALLAYEYVPGRTLDEVSDEELTDELLIDVWRQLERLQTARLAHRRLEGGSVLISPDGRAHLVDLRAGEIAAGDLQLRLDVAQLLATLALRVGPERAVRTAVEVLGEDALGRVVPLLQRVALSRQTRGQVRREKDLLTRIREQILRLHPEMEVEPVRLERFRPRTIVSIVALSIAAYIVIPQVSSVNVVRLVTDANWWWVIVGLAASATTFVAAAFMLMGFVPERLPLWRTILVQLAASFVKLVAPAAVTGVAINTRYLQRAGVRPGPAVASVGASQLTGLIMHILLLAVFGFITGSSRDAPDLAPSRTVITVLLAVGVLAGVAAAIPPVRRLVVNRLKSMFSGVLPRLLDVFQSPKKIITGFGGTLLLTAAFVVCLDASIRAFGGSLEWTAIAVVFLTGNALGSAAPTPGGLGAVETALSLGLTFSGLPAETATSAVLLFRLLTFWLPVLPGWASFAYLQRKQAL
ncbi:lysylphosphatidylglycerol synthase transmembrane domain-containing protein [Actinomadura craniellae]|uniref:lysylphosphatidylglycerol synthase transmembrane domain-containing protein n=1 Tax=Actinomadura craniellae TaxID=2231787 RepID=UPI001F39D6CB|nr:lysylphosphatidylglycerol synthase transmembrane domain-containing protein [Actinomadura craniellae]